ncbi:MAG: DUF3768 domain-containing protein [Gammaproteobacteria bacterium]|nr:DUF3768 domain-containing protein [Gammaproteobacteria bacterium]
MDYYDPTKRSGSEDPDGQNRTMRVTTIIHAAEY